MADAAFSSLPIKVDSPNVVYDEANATINASYTYETTEVSIDGGVLRATPTATKYTLSTETKLPKTGMMIVGWGGNNGTTVTGGIIANKLGMSWRTRTGVQKANYYGSITQASTIRLGHAAGRDVYVPFTSMLPMVKPEDLVIGGWDISSANMRESMERAAVLDIALQDQLAPHMEKLTPLPSIYYPDFIAANQSDRADHLLPTSHLPSGAVDKWAHVEAIRAQIREFKESNGLDKVVILWSANTERFSDVKDELNGTADALLASIKEGAEEVSPSTVFAVASILEGCSYINGSPQNTFVPGVVELAERERVFIGGDDFKSGQTKMKSVLTDFLVSAGIKPTSIASYNHLGNNDGKNLSAPQQFRSKEISKSNVVDDMVSSNRLLYARDEHPDHVVVIKYVPYVGDSKRALDEYTSEIFLGGTNTIAMHNTCEDSLLASPLIIDLVVLTELAERITVTKEGAAAERFHPVLSLLSYMLKAPMVPDGTPVVNALFRQRECVLNILRACTGLPAESHMSMECRVPSAMAEARARRAEAEAFDAAGDAEAASSVHPASLPATKLPATPAAAMDGSGEGVVC